jgi:hypothetical protein
LAKAPNSHWWSTKINASNGTLLEKADLMISCNFDFPVETDAKPSRKSSHKNHSHSYEKDNLHFNFKNDGKNTVVLKSKSNVAAVSEAADGSKYTAFALGVETPNHGLRTLIENPAVIATQPLESVVPSPQGWHDFAGERQLKTLGNNVNAYEDGGDLNEPANDSSYAEITTPETLTFDYPLDLTAAPIAYQKAATVNLFVWNNYMHDVSYAYGFDENNGNFQEDQYERFNPIDAEVGFNAGDEVQAEAQDGSGLNNANFGTLVDGIEPTMQMFLWGASPFGEFFDVIEPSAADILGSYPSARFPFEPIPREEDDSIDALLVLVEDDATPYTGVDDGGTAGESLATDDGCTTYTAASADAVTGKIAVIMRGTCTFVKKITLAQQNGAIAVIIINNVAEDGPVNGGGEEYEEITIPAISLSLENGELLLERMSNGEEVFVD